MFNFYMKPCYWRYHISVPYRSCPGWVWYITSGDNFV